MDITEIDKNELWEQVVSQVVEGSASPDHAGGILNSATINHIDDTSVILSFPTQLMKNGADRSYVEKIQDALYGLVGRDMDVTTIVDSSLPFETYQPLTQTTSSTTSYSQPSNLTQFSQNKVIKPLNTIQSPPTFMTETNTTPVGSNSLDHYTNKLTFDSFVSGESNRMAYTTAMAVAERPGTSYNPLFIYGKSGLGKTHLLCAIYNYINRFQPNLYVCYCSAKSLLDDIIAMARSKDWTLFDKKYGAADVLLIDDIQYLEHKPESTERVFQLQSEFIMKSKQIVISADRSPKEIDMDERITSRFIQGLMVDIQPPTFEMKLGIIRNYKDRELPEVPLSDEVLTYVAEISSSNVREIEGALGKLGAYYSLSGSSRPVTINDAQDVLKDVFHDNNRKLITTALIQREVEKYYNITHEEIISSRRDRKINTPRQVAMYLCRDMTDESFPSIGKKFGGRDHATVMNGVRKIEGQLKENREFYDRMEQLKQTIKEKA